MTQNGADRLMIGGATAIGFLAGGFAGVFAGGNFTPRKWSEHDRDSAATIFGVGGALVGAVIGSVLACPPAADKQVGTSDALHLAPIGGFP